LNIKKSFFAIGLSTALSLACAETTIITGTVTGDRYHSPHAFSGATSPVTPLFVNLGDSTFSVHYSQMPVKWTLTIPPSLVGQSLKVTSASVVLWQAKDSEQLWEPNDGILKLFAVGFTSNNGLSAATWTESQTYIGPGGPINQPQQDPFLVELGTGLRAENNINAVPWATGIVPDYYTGGGPTEAFPIRFNLDVQNTEVQNKLKTDLQNGYAMWAAVSTFVASDPTGPVGTTYYYPKLVNKEGVGNTAYGTLQNAPALILEVEPVQSGVQVWNLY